MEKGYRAVSMRQIAAKLNVSHGSIYYHFKNKVTLFYAIVAEGFSQLDEELESTLSMEVGHKEKLREIFMTFIRFGVTHSNHYEMMFLMKDEELNTLMNQEPNESYNKFAAAVYQLCDPQNVTTQKIWSAFLSLHGFVTHYFRSEQTFEEIEGLAKQHADFILKSLDM